jgi:sigma-B regulation protein RsbU (phosphoserine phosphatase)
MACTIGHKINNPLSSLIFALATLKNEMHAEKLPEEFEVIEKSITRIKNLASDLIQLKEPKIVDYIPGTGMLKL